MDGCFQFLITLKFSLIDLRGTLMEYNSQINEQNVPKVLKIVSHL